MKSDYTHIAVILDRTGSMQSIRDDVIGGFNAFLRDQKAVPGTATLTLVQFDTQNPYEVVHGGKPIADVPELTRDTYVPRASTPLLDAMGRGINDLEKCLADLAEADRPEKVIMVFITDGQENASCEFGKDQIVKMIKEKEQQGWQFVYLSADLGAIREALALGIDPDFALLHAKDAAGTAAAWSSLSSNVSASRVEPKRKIGFKRSDRKHPDDPQRKPA
jgi:Mg-chelatase subunit ChlD